MIGRLLHVARAIVREKRKGRSGKWPAVRATHLKKQPTCAACKGKKVLQVHHVEPYHIDPTKELDLANLITLCAWNRCHFELGHGGDYEAYAPAVREIAAEAVVNPKSAILRKSLEERAKKERLYEDPQK